MRTQRLSLVLLFATIVVAGCGNGGSGGGGEGDDSADTSNDPDATGSTWDEMAWDEGEWK